MIVITKSFKKYLTSIKSIKIQEVVTEIHKHINGLKNFVKIEENNGNTIYKGYLLSKKVRLLVYYEHVESIYMPFFIVKKESKKGENIFKGNISDSMPYLYKSQNDIDNGDYKLIND